MVVSDSSALINLACIGKLAILLDLYGEVYVPEAVWREAVERGKGQAGASEIESAPWIKTQIVAIKENSNEGLTGSD
jgi:uncharacterized protein